MNRARGKAVLSACFFVMALTLVAGSVAMGIHRGDEALARDEMACLAVATGAVAFASFWAPSAWVLYSYIFSVALLLSQGFGGHLGRGAFFAVAATLSAFLASGLARRRVA